MAVGATLAGWALAPAATLIAFLAVSGLHFGAESLDRAPHQRTIATVRATVQAAVRAMVRATTPVLPIFLIHPAGVAPFIAALAGRSEAATLHLLYALRWPLLPLWAAALAFATLPALLGDRRDDRPGVRRGESRRALDAAELLAVALAAAVLPPLVAFGLYFCLVHAVRHMLEVAADHHPRRPGAALALAAGIVVPSAIACLAALWFAWDGLAGCLDTAGLVTWGLRVVAALTMPHMALEWWASRGR